MLFPVYISITTPLGLAQELWEDGWRLRGLLCLSCALGPGNKKGRKALEEEEGPWKEMRFLGRKCALGRDEGPGKEERPWELPILHALTYAH